MVDATHHGDEPDTDSYAARLALALREAKLEYRAFAARMGITHMGVYKVLKGQSAFLQTPQHFAACRLLKIRPEWLALGEGPMRNTGQADVVDYRNLAVAIISEHPDASARELMLELIDLVDTKAAQMRQVAGQRALAHTP
ncbi:MAG: hypothetical protein EOP37_03310 [Rubrivivax sp.]|nr:MAG: hypothetical protein EOP37_03310 [Rubrivivax sp.]